MEKTTRAICYVGIAFLIIGIIGWTLQLTGGLLSGSGMTNIFLWGLMIAIFAFMVGFGAGAQIIASIIFLMKKDDLIPLARTAAAIGLACVSAAGVAILADLGAIRNILFMMTNLNFRSPLAWDMMALTAFVILSVIQLVMIARKSASVKVWAALVGICAIALQIIEGLLFSTQSAHPWWATPIMPVDFLAVSVVSGSALILLIGCIKKVGVQPIAWLCRICAVAVAVHLALALCDMALIAFKATAATDGVLDAVWAQFPLYLCELLLPAVGMIILFATARSDNATAKIIAAALIILGIFFHRLMLLYPAYNAPSLYLTLSGTNSTTGPYPISTGRYLDWDQTFSLTTNYLPALQEWMSALLPIGIAIVATYIILWVMKKISRSV